MDEKVFTVATPKDAQNDRLYTPAAMKKRDVTAERLLHTRATFCQSLMVSVGMSKLGCTHLIFIDPGVKINGCYSVRCFEAVTAAAVVTACITLKNVNNEHLRVTEVSCLHYLLPDKCDSSVTDRLRHAKTFELPQARTNKF